MRNLKDGIDIYEWPDGSRCRVNWEDSGNFHRRICFWKTRLGKIPKVILRVKEGSKGKDGEYELGPMEWRIDYAIGLAIGLRAPMKKVKGCLEFEVFDARHVTVPFFLPLEEIKQLEARLDSFQMLNKANEISFVDEIKIGREKIKVDISPTGVLLASDVIGGFHRYPLEGQSPIRLIRALIESLGARIGTFEEWAKDKVGVPIGISQDELDLYDAMGVPMPLWSRNYEEAKAFLEEVASRAP